MNIMVVCHYGLYQRPESSFVHAQTKEYVKLGHRVRVLLPVALGKSMWDQGRWTAHACVVDGVELFPMRYLSLSSYGEGHFNTASASVCLKRCIPHLFKDFLPDVIHAHTLGLDSELGALLKEQLHVPLVVTTHGSDSSVPYENGTITRLCATCDHADHIVAVSSALAEKVRASGTAAPISVVLNGFRGENCLESGERTPFSIIQVGSLTRQKCPHHTITAFSKLKQRYPQAALTILGEGTERKALEQQCRELGVQDSVSFLGQRPNREVLNQLSRHVFFVLPSVREGFGIVYLEAMASGCLTIGTQGEGIADFIRDGENGFLVPPEFPDAIAEKILWCFDHPKETEQIARRGRQDALVQTWEKNAREYIALFETLKNNI